MNLWTSPFLLVLNQGNALDVTISLDQGAAEGFDADWWVYAKTTSIGTYWYEYGTGWIESETPIPAYQGELIPVTNLKVLGISTLPAGNYDFYFEVDERNNIKEGARSDEVNVTIQ